MKSFLFCTTFFGLNTWHHDAQVRYERWLRFYSRNLLALGAEKVFLIDDGSSPELIRLPGVTVLDADAEMPSELPPGPIMFRFSVNLGRTPVGFPGWWRSFTYSLRLAERYGYERIVHIESDAFVISRRMAAYIRSREAGWTTFAQSQFRDWATVLRQPRRRWETVRQYLRNKLRYGLFPWRYPVYPESALQVICSDSYDRLREFLYRGEAYWGSAVFAEFELPFSEVNQDFIGQRYGEFMYRDYPMDADYVAQAAETWNFEHVCLTD